MDTFLLDCKLTPKINQLLKDSQLEYFVLTIKNNYDNLICLELNQQNNAKIFKVEAQQTIDISKIDLTDLIKGLHFRFSFKLSNMPDLNKEFELQLNKKIFTKNFSDFINNKSVNLKWTVINPILKEKSAFTFSFNPPKVNKIVSKSNNKKFNFLEIDLHLSSQSNHFLTEQLEMAEKALHSALIDNYSEIRFIHGLGRGVLKKQLLLKLKDPLWKKHIVKVDDGYHPKYGYGVLICQLQ